MTWVLIGGGIFLLFGFVVFFGAPYVPSQRKFIRRAFEQLYPLSAQDTLIDIGSGDGVVLRIAAEKKARAIGYEINPLLVVISRLLAKGNSKIETRLANFWNVNLPKETTIVYAFSVSRDGAKLIKKLQQQATLLEKPLTFMCLGSPLPGISPEKMFEAYYLYRFHPLHTSDAHV